MRRFWQSIRKRYGNWSREFPPAQANVAYFLDLLLESDDLVRDLMNGDYDHVFLTVADWRKAHKLINSHSKFMKKLLTEQRSEIVLTQLLESLDEHVRLEKSKKA